VAVFPDRIVLKNSTDSATAIIAALEPGGTDEITQGEIVLGLTASDVNLYTLNSSNNIVAITGGGGGGSGGLVFWGGGDFTTGTSDGAEPDGGVFT
jgi:hypothetical protein